MQNSSNTQRARINQRKWRRNARFTAMIGGAVAFLLGFLIPVADQVQRTDAANNGVLATIAVDHAASNRDEG